MDPADLLSVLFSDEDSGPGKAQAYAQALKGKTQLGQLGLLSGDKVLSGLGQSLLQGVGRDQGALGEYAQHTQSTRLQQAMAALKQKQEAAINARESAEQEARDGRQNAAAMERARVLAGYQANAAEAAREAAANRGTNVPGLEKEPGAEPTPDDAKKVKASLESARKIQAMTAELKELGKNGPQMTGRPALRMGQLQTAIKLEAKNIAELGALSGPDIGLVNELTGVDLTSLGSKLKSLVGIDNHEEALSGLEKWTENALGSAKKTYGYRDAPKAPAQAAVPPGMSLDDEDAQAMAWARANPKDKRAKAILQLHGGGR